jgi:cyclic pyranopterin phosphate synthase
MTSQGPPDDQPKAFSHLDAAGRAWMVDVGDKAVTLRSARASGTVHMSEETLERIMEQAVKKGDVLAVARVAGILAAKRTADLIPLCHPLSLTHVSVELTPRPGAGRVEIAAEVHCQGQTGVEMEALTAVSVAALTVYDMVKSLDRGLVIGDIVLEEKSGGKSGTYRRL